MTRNGKIARLPAAVREEVNRRLEDGQKSNAILPWLNALPEVKAVIDAEFGGHLIIKQNLSEWKTGGYADWAAGRRLCESVGAFLEDSASIEAVAEGRLTERMGTMLAATMADQMRKLHRMPEGVEKAKIWRELRISLLALRRSELYAVQLSMQAAKQGDRRKGPRPESVKRPQTRQSIMDMLGIGEGFDGSIHPELTRSPDFEAHPNVKVNPTESE